jgi:hypothetical protein
MAASKKAEVLAFYPYLLRAKRRYGGERMIAGAVG